MLLTITGQELRCGLSFQSAAEAEIFASAVKAAIAASGSNGSAVLHLPAVGELECGAQQRFNSTSATASRGAGGGRYTQRGRGATGAIVATCAVCTGSTVAYTVRKSFGGDTSDLDTSQGAMSSSTAISKRRRPTGLGSGSGGGAPVISGRDEESTTSDLGLQLSSSVCSSQTDPTHTLSPSSVPLVVTAAEQSERRIELEPESPIGERRDSKLLLAMSRQGRLLHTASESNILQAKIVVPERLPRMAAFNFQRATPSTRERHPLQLAIGGGGVGGSVTPRSLSTSATYYSLAASGPQSSSPARRRQGSQNERRWTFHISHLFHHQTHHQQRTGSSANSGGNTTGSSGLIARVAFSSGGGGPGQHREPAVAITSAISSAGRRTGSTPYMPPSTRGSQRSTGSARSSHVEQVSERPFSYRRRRCIYCGKLF